MMVMTDESEGRVGTSQTFFHL